MSKKRKRTSGPFGFDVMQFFDNLIPACHLGAKTHSIQNYIRGFGPDKQPSFEHPNDCFQVEEQDGLFAILSGRKSPVYAATLHTRHTVSLLAIAYQIIAKLKCEESVKLVRGVTTEFKSVDISKSVRKKQETSHTTIYTNVFHQGQPVVLKTIYNVTRMAKCVLDAVIHHLVSCRCPNLIPKLHFIGMTSDRRMVVCSEQLLIPSVTTWTTQLALKKSDNEHRAWTMLHSVCRTLDVVQNNAQLTHRDLHTSNVFYDEQRQKARLIDFDWSVVRHGDSTISVPRFLYDTRGKMYGRNRSVDLCIFLRSLRKRLSGAHVFLNCVVKPLLQRYEAEARKVLFTKNSPAAKQLYKMSTVKKTLSSTYSHKYGIQRTGIEFDYRMGYYEWSTMTPSSVLRFLERHRM